MWPDRAHYAAHQVAREILHLLNLNLAFEKSQKKIQIDESEGKNAADASGLTSYFFL